MSRFSVALLISTIGVCLCAAPVFSSTWHVEQNGTGDFLEIQDAVNASAAGDTILIGRGNYNQAREVQIPQYPAPTDAFVNLTVEDLTLIGVGSDEVIIGPDEPYSVYYGPLGICAGSVNQSWRIEGVTLRNLDTGIYTYTRVEVDRCRFEENVTAGIALLNTDGALIEGSQFSNNLSNGIINYNVSSGIRIGDCEFDYSIVYLRSAIGATVERCNFYGGYSYGGTGGLYFNAASGIASSCEFWELASFAIAGTDNAVVQVVGCITHAGTESGSGIIADTYARFSVSSSILEGWYAGVRISGGGSMTINDSHILSGTGYLVYCNNQGGTDPTHMNFTNNYWGTTDLSEIDAGIRDKNDDNNLTTIIDYLPIANGPVSLEQKSFGDLKAMFR